MIPILASISAIMVVGALTVLTVMVRLIMSDD